MTVAVSVLRRLYMLGLGALALSFWGICGIAVLIFIAIVWMRTADFALLVYKNHFIIAWLVGASIAMLALFIDWVGRRRSRTLTISTQDGFWGSAAFAAAVATVIGMGTSA